MGFILKRVSDVGSCNPIVARLSLQFAELIEFYNLDESKKESIIELLTGDIQKRLLSCHKEALEVTNEISDALNKIKENGLPIQSGGRVIESPHIIRLEERIESYLYNAKSCLRDVLKVYNILFDTNFTEARYDKAIQWATEKFGENDGITKFLTTDHDHWIHQLVKMRNAVEHPGGYSGHLHIQNFEIVTSNGKKGITEPTWNLNDDVATLIRKDLFVFVENILELIEDVVISALEKFGKSPILAIIEIPKDKRREEAPIRFRMGLPQEIES